MSQSILTVKTKVINEMQPIYIHMLHNISNVHRGEALILSTDSHEKNYIVNTIKSMKVLYISY